MSGTPIEARLGGTDLSETANWLQKNRITPHTVIDAFYSTKPHTPIQNPIPNVYEYYQTLDGVGSLKSFETETASTGGGHFVGSSVSETDVFSANSVNTFSIKNLLEDFMTARNQGGLTFSVILHGKQSEFNSGKERPEYTESSYLRAITGGTPYDPDFYKKSSWVSFHSRESPHVPTISESTSVSFRKNFHHGLLKLTASEVAGISQDAGNASIRSFGSFNWSSVPGLSAGSIVTFNEKTAPQNEALSASGNGSPSVITCSSKTLVFSGLVGNDAVFQNNLSSTTLFSGAKTPQVNALIRWGDANYGSGTQLYTIPQSPSVIPSLTIRTYYAASYGADNLLAVNLAEGSKRFFGGSDNIGIGVGSYIEISGALNASNNGIYRVEAVFDGVPGDSNEVINETSLPPYQYLRLSRSIVPENMGNRITVRNVSNLPILHVKYTQVVTP
jgi:hypothetical protein